MAILGRFNDFEFSTVCSSLWYSRGHPESTTLISQDWLVESVRFSGSELQFMKYVEKQNFQIFLTIFLISAIFSTCTLKHQFHISKMEDFL